MTIDDHSIIIITIVFFFFAELHAFLDELSKKHGSPYRIWLGPIMAIFITDAESAEILLKSKDCLNKPHTFYKMIRDGISVDGLFTLKGLFSDCMLKITLIKLFFTP